MLQCDPTTTLYLKYVSDTFLKIYPTRGVNKLVNGFSEFNKNLPTISAIIYINLLLTFTTVYVTMCELLKIIMDNTFYLLTGLYIFNETAIQSNSQKFEEYLLELVEISSAILRRSRTAVSNADVLEQINKLLPDDEVAEDVIKPENTPPPATTDQI